MAAGMRRKQHGYWQADGLVELELSRFRAATAKYDAGRQRRLFYKLAFYHGRTLHILNSAIESQNDELTRTALHNLKLLHRTLVSMHRAAPDSIPVPFVLTPEDRHEFARDLVMRVLMEAPAGLSLHAVSERVNHLDMLGDVPDAVVANHLATLVNTGHVVEEHGHYRHTSRPFLELEIDAMSLRALAGSDLHGRFAAAGYPGLRDVDDRGTAFRDLFQQATGLSDDTAHLFTDTCDVIRATTLREASLWHTVDLLHTPYPRPYQREAFAVFRRGDHKGLVVEAPTGSGKTLIGMLAIQDWLRGLQSGQAILILVPTTNYQQQWFHALAYDDIGLQLPPEILFSGTPSQLQQFISHTGAHPAIILLTYTALAQLGSAVGKGGFDRDSVETFLQSANIQYVILDEVHKVVEDMHSTTTAVTRLLVEWLNDTSLRALIGFSGTADAYRSRFSELGLRLAHSVPIDDLVAAGFVAPFAEIGLPFAYSTRERCIRSLLDEYKDLLRDYYALLGPAALRDTFATLPDEQRAHIAHDLLGMYQHRSDWQPALRKRFAEWEAGDSDSIKLTEAPLVSILQIANGWSDAVLLDQFGADTAAYDAILTRLNAIRDELSGLIYLPSSRARLQAPDFGTQLDMAQLQEIDTARLSIAARRDAVKNVLSATITGLYDALREWYLRVGEGRVEVIKAIIEAERAARPVRGIIVFDTGRKLHWRKGTAVPGYEGVGGLFAHMLGDKRFTAMAALSSEMYFTYDERNLPAMIAGYIETHLMLDEVASAIKNLALHGLQLAPEAEKELRDTFDRDIQKYVPRVRHLRARRDAEFNRRVLKPLRERVKQLNLGLDGERIRARLDAKNTHLRGLVETFFDYALLATHFREAHVAELEQVSGATQQFYVVPMPGTGHRKQLMYDLTSTIVDAPELPINLVIVSTWARTGWNVIKPNVLIDATATRDVTAWQQLRGRAIRALRTWTNDANRLLTILLGDHALHGVDETAADQEAHELDENLLTILEEVAQDEEIRDLVHRDFYALPYDYRHALALVLMQTRNKVTHIYELIKAYGSTSQVQYDRAGRRWQRKDAIAAKHDHEIGVNLLDGEKSTGVSHAPLIYAGDPREDAPEQLEEALGGVLDQCDDRILDGWLGTNGRNNAAS